MCDMRCDKHSGKETLNAVHFGASYGYIVTIKTARFGCDETMFDVSVKGHKKANHLKNANCFRTDKGTVD